MFNWTTFFRSALALVFIIAVDAAVYPQRNVLWERVDIPSRNLFLGPGGSQMRPNLRRVHFIQKETSGNNLKYRIRDASGRIWIAKIADESQPETAAVRLLWGIGYKSEVNYLVPVLRIPGKGTFRNVRLEARPANVKRLGNWHWEENPFVGTNELQGLKIMMALVNNWDLKATNNEIFGVGDERQYVISDLGSSFGKLAVSSKPLLNRIGRSVNRPEHYVESDFIKGRTPDGFIDFAYKGNKRGIFEDVTVEHGQWLAALLMQLSDKQIADAFRAARYSPSQVRLLTRAVRYRTEELTRPGPPIAEN
jgi:hypothetical protein